MNITRLSPTICTVKDKRWAWNEDKTRPKSNSGLLPCSFQASLSSSVASQEHWHTACPGLSSFCTQHAPGEENHGVSQDWDYTVHWPLD